MRIGYIHGYEGVTASLLLGGLLDLGASPANVEHHWQQLGLPPATLTCTRIAGAEMAATQVTLAAPQATTLLQQQAYTDLVCMIEQSAASASLQQRVLRVLQRFVEAVAHVHGVANGGELALRSAFLPDLLYLASGVASALEELAIDSLAAAPLPLGAGWIDGPQERRPVPHPLTAALSRGVPTASVGVPPHEERTTVDGAAILTALAEHFGPPPDMTIAGTGYGYTRIAPTDAPCRLQVLLGDTVGPAAAERIAVIEANIDDMNPEFYESIAERLFAQGALDVTLTPLYMKKNRPANTLTVLAPLAAVSRLAHLMLQETSTFGVRVHEVWRHKLDRFHRQVETRYGSIPVKCGVLEGRIVQAAPEYDACKRLAREQGVPVRLVYAEAASLAASWLANA
jgi:uncharacterized protein (DUF111 family)